MANVVPIGVLAGQGSVAPVAWRGGLIGERRYGVNHGLGIQWVSVALDLAG